MTEAKKKPARLGDLLVEKGLITEDQLEIALVEQKRRGVPLGKVLVMIGFVSDAIMRDVLAELLGQKSVDLTKVVPESEALKLVPKDIARRYQLIPVTWDSEKHVLTVAMADTFNVVALDQTAALLGGDLDIHPLLATEVEIEAAIDSFYGYELSVEGILNELDTGKVDYQSLQRGGDEYSQPLVRLVDALLANSVKRGASDIHFEPENGFLRIRDRIDGVLRSVLVLHKGYWSGIVVRLKVMSGMNIAETRAPQDGRISLTLGGRHVDFRVATQPVTFGENIVLRVLDSKKGIVPLDKLNLTEHSLTLIKLMMARPEGIILVTGPTGSGKTTTLYSMLNHLNDESINIMTLEDPVEYTIPLIRQSSVNKAIKMDFADGIRSMMRQDPDIILVGEIRDKDTSEMAFRAAMTGHQVFSTLHTNSALGIVPRLLDIGVKPDIMAGNIIGIVAQRLVRTLCNHCKKAYFPTGIEIKLLGLDKEDDSEVQIYQAVGCKECDNMGYKGRISLMEVLKMDSELDELIVNHASIRQLKEKALSKGFIPLADDGVRAVLHGVTSLDEVSRVIDLTDKVVEIKSGYGYL